MRVLVCACLVLMTTWSYTTGVATAELDDELAVVEPVNMG